MKKITLDQFRRNAAEADTSLRLRKAREGEDRLRSLVESTHASLGGVSTLLNVAWLDSLMDGFPSEIHLASPNGYMSGVHVRRRQGKWAFEFAPDSRHDAFPQSVPRTGSDLGAVLLKAMGVPHSPPAFQQIVDLAKWPKDDLRSFLDDVGGKLPLDVMRASVGHLTALLARHGVEHDSIPMATGTWIDHVHNVLGGDLSAPLAGRKHSPAMIAAASSHAFVLVAMKANGADVDRPMPADHPAAGATPLQVALGHGNLHTALVLLEKLDASPILRQNAMKETALHVLAQGVLLRPTHPYAEEARRLARGIALAGVDPEARDHHGRTAADLIREILDEPNPERELDRYAREELTKIQEVLEDPIPNATEPMP